MMYQDGTPILASSSSTGSIATWDLSRGGRIIHVHRGAHEQAVSGLEWVAGQPLLISSSGDNSVKVSDTFRLWFGTELYGAMVV